MIVRVILSTTLRTTGTEGIASGKLVFLNKIIKNFREFLSFRYHGYICSSNDIQVVS